MIATDVSQAQVDQARTALREHTNVEIKIGGGERLEVEDASLHLVSTCQALHWIQLEQFYSEVSRVLVPGGALAVIGYHMTSPGPSVNNAVKVKIRSLERNKVMTGTCSYGRR